MPGPSEDRRRRIGEGCRVFKARMGAGVAVVAACLLTSSGASAVVIGGGGSARTDCLAVFESLADPQGSSRRITCVDGDSSCDADGVVDGQCSFDLSVCANSTYSPKCSSVGVESIFVEHSEDNGDEKFDPNFQAIQSRIDGELTLPGMAEDCTALVRVAVPLQGPFPGNRCKGSRKKIRMTTRSVFDVSAGKVFVDRDTLNLVCRPAPAECDPRDLFSGTHDRIQKQLFNSTCATGGCHDSESNASDLILEAGSSHSSLVDQPTVNGVAAALGWLRVKSGNPGESFLMQKIDGGLGPGLGARMPLRGKKVPSFMREIVRKWIEDGSPLDGWVTGTD